MYNGKLKTSSLKLAIPIYNVKYNFIDGIYAKIAIYQGTY